MRKRTAMALVSVLGLVIGLMAAVSGFLPQVANAAVTSGTARSVISFHSDTGNNTNSAGSSVWAYDSFTRTETIKQVGAAPLSDCAHGAPACYAYSFTESDSGTFQTVPGGESPGATAMQLDVVESGTFTGSLSGTLYDSYKNVYPSDVHTTLNDDGLRQGDPGSVDTADESTTGWAYQFFGGAGYANYSTVQVPDYIFSYSVAKGSDAQCPSEAYSWVDSSSNGGGDTASDGNIYAPNSIDCAGTSPTVKVGG